MAYEGPEYWYVIYKAIADFGDVMRDAAQVKSAMQGMADASKAQAAAEVAGAQAAAAARQKDILAIQQESAALSQLATSAKQTNVQLLYGGRNDMTQHLADLAQELNYTTLLNRQKWLGFSSVQQAMSYRQQMYNLALLENKAHFAGYLTADQYLGFLQREIAATSSLSAAIRDRSAAIALETSNLLAHTNALQGTHQTVGQLGEQLSNAAGFATALAGVPELVQTRAIFDDGGALAQIATYRAALAALQNAESTDIVSVTSRLGGVPLPAEPVPVRAAIDPVLSGPLSVAAIQRQMAMLGAEVARPRVELQGAPEVLAETAAIRTELAALNGTQPAITSGGGDTEPSGELVKYTWWVDRIPDDVVTHATFDDSEATSELQDWVARLTSMIRDRYVFYAELDDTDALSTLNQFVQEVKAGELSAEQAVRLLDLAAGSGGAAGGGGGGSPPRALPPGADEPNPDDAAAWEALGKAERDATPNPADSAAWEELGKAENDAKMSAAEAVSALQDAARAAAASGDAASAGRYSWAAYIFQLSAAKAAGTSAEDDITLMARLAATSDDATKAAQLAFAAQNLLSSALISAGSGATKAAGGLTSMVQPLVESTGGWFGLNTQLRVFGGLLGTVAAWHVVVDAIIEALAVLVPAIVTMVAGLTAFGIAGSDAGREVYARLTAIHTAADATGQSLAPLTGNLEALHDQVRPQVWELYGDAITIAGAKSGIFNQLALQTGNVLDRLAARVTVDLSSARSGLETFFSVGGQDLAKLGTIFSNLGLALLALIKVTTETHVDQIFLNIFVALSKLLDLITKLPTPVLAAVIGLHAFWLWGGLLATVVMQLLNPLRSLALALGAVDAASVEGGLASLTEDSSAWQRLKAGLNDIIAGFGALITRITGVGSAVRTAAGDAAAAAGTVGAAGGGAAAVGAAEGAAADTALVAGEAAVAGTAAGVGEDIASGLDKGVTESAFETAFARLTDAVTSFGAKTKAAVAAAIASLAAVPDAVQNMAEKVAAYAPGTADELAAAVRNQQALGGTFTELAQGVSANAALLEKYGTGLSDADKETVALALHSGATEEQVSSLASSLTEDAAAAGNAAGGAGLFASAMSKLGPVLGNVWVDLGILVAALIGVGIYLGLRSDQTKQWTDSLGAAIDKASALTVVSTTVSNLAAVTNELALAQRTGVGNATELAASQQDLSDKLGTELAHVGDVSRAYGTNFVGALELLNTAGVKTSDIFDAQGKTWAADMEQVNGLIQGYKAMGQGLTELQQDVSVQLVTTSDQVTAMGKLNQAWDTFQQLVAAPLTTVLTLAQGFSTFATDAKAAGASMIGLSDPALTLQQQFQTLYGNVQSTFDAMRNSEAVTGSGGFVSFVKNAVQALIPLAGGNKAAAAEISQLAQEAGGPATTSLKSLSQWAGNSKNPLLGMYDAAQQATIGASNLSADAQRLTTTLQQDLNPAMAQAIFNAHGGQAVFSTFADTLEKSGPKSQATITAARSVATELLAVSGNSANAKANFVGFGEAMGLSASQADKLWSQATTHMTGNLKQVRDQLAQTASSAVTLSQPGLWGQIEHVFMAAWDGVFNWFSNSVPHAFELTWDSIFAWFAQSVPHAFGTVWNDTWRDLGAPVVRAFDSVKGFIASSFDGWWKTHGESVELIWNSVWGAIKGTAVTTFDSVVQLGSTFWHNLVADFDSGPMKTLWSGFSQAGSFAWDQIKQAAQAAFVLMETLFTAIGHIAQAAWQLILLSYRAMWSSAEAFAKLAWDAIVAIVSVAIDLITGHWATAWKDIQNFGEQAFNILKSLGVQLFNDLEQAAYGIWQLIFRPIWGWFNTQFVVPLQHFFTSTLVSWWNSALLLARTAWSNTWSSFNSTVLTPLQHFFTADIPNWWNDLLKEARSTWTSVWTAFSTTILSPLTHFFTGDVPTWWNDFTNAAKKAWSNTWAAFNSDILGPVERFFTSTLPNAMWNSLKGGIDHVIGGLNTVIGWINDVTSIVGVHIGTIPTLATGGGVPMGSGSVPGTGDEDRTHVIAMGGEYMLRKPARMALQAAFGPDFLDSLNNADTWLGSGSRGNAASQRGTWGGRYASGGILNTLGSWLGDAVGDLEKGAEAAWNGIGSVAKEVASFGEKAAFDAMWGALGAPAESAMKALGTPGAMGAGWLQEVHNGVETYIGAQTAKAKAVAAPAGGINAAGVSNSSAEMALASAANKMGWGGSEWQALYDVEMREAGFSLTATNPSSGAYGMAQFINGPSEYAQYGGNANTAAGQAVAMVNYIKQRYGDPEAAWAHELAYGWYASGGPVISAIKAATSNAETREAMALGAYLLSKWDTTASVPKSTEYGPWLIPTSKHKGFTVKDAENPVTAARLMAPYYSRGVMNSTVAEWKAAPSAAAMYAAVYAAHAAGTSFSQPSTAALNTAWTQVNNLLNPPAPTIGTTDTINQADVKAWAKDSPQISPTWQTVASTWGSISKMPRPGGLSTATWNNFTKYLATMAKDETAASSAVAKISSNITSPQVLKAADWTAAEKAMATYYWEMQHVPLVARYHFPWWQTGMRSAKGLGERLSASASDWAGVWGTQVVPGIQVTTPGAGSGAGSGSTTTVDLSQYITGGPAVGSTGGLGFAAGGSLSDVAAMFSGGMASGGVLPGLVIPGLSTTLQKQLAGAAQGQLPRTMSDAAGDTVGLQVGNLTINNPVPERPSDSITRSSNRLAFMAGRGIA